MIHSRYSLINRDRDKYIHGLSMGSLNSGSFWGASEKTLLLGKIEGRRSRGRDGWMASPLNGHEFEQAPGDGEGQGGLACCSPWGCKELDTTD